MNAVLPGACIYIAQVILTPLDTNSTVDSADAYGYHTQVEKFTLQRRREKKSFFDVNECLEVLHRKSHLVHME